MSRRARLALVLGCLGVSALHLPRATHAAREGLLGPYRDAVVAGEPAPAAEAERLGARVPPRVARAPRPGEGM